MSERRKKIGILIGNIHTVFPTKLIEGFSEWSARENVDLLFILGTESTGFSLDNGEREEDYDYQYATIYDYALFGELDGLIIAYGLVTAMQEISDKETFLKKFAGTPSVILQEPVEMNNAAYIVSDNYAGIYEVVEHLIKVHGYRNILFLSGPMSNYDARERKQAYIDAMKAHGYTVTKKMIAYGDYSEFVESKVKELLDNNDNIEAIVCANDEMAQCVYRVFAKRGIRPGRDIAVTGFDDIPRSKLLDPPLTTVRQMADYMAVTSMKMINDMIDGERIESRKIPVEFVQRGSCGCEYELYDRRRENSVVKQGESVSNMMEKVTRNWQRSLSGPFVIRKLINLAEDIDKFIKEILRELRAQGSKNSYLYLLPDTVVVDEHTKWKTPEEIYLRGKQIGEKISVYSRSKAKPTPMGGGIIKDRLEGNFYTFLLMDGNRQYGIVSCEIDVDDISVFHMLALQIGTAFHFYEIVQKEAEAREKLMEQNNLLNFSATIDELTGAFNRRGILERVLRIGHTEQGKEALVLMADLDHLKEINDTFGHGEGDVAIRTAANILRGVCGNNSSLGRLGGDEFFAIKVLEDGEDPDETAAKLDKDIIDGCVAYNVVSGKPYFLGISHGIIHLTVTDEIDFSTILEQSDELLYEAKKSRRKSIRRDLSS